MNILITGALGHIGSKLLEKLNRINKIKKVYIIDDESSGSINTLFNLKHKKISFFFIKGNLLSNKILNGVKDKIHIVIHLASITNAEDSFRAKNLVYKNNYGIFKNVCNFCVKKKSKLIHLSSTSVYGVQSNIVDENCKTLKPQSPYADVKILEEKFLKNKKKINYITLRFGTIAGPSKGMKFHTAVNKFCLKTILGEKIPVWNQAINQYRPYLSLNDAVRAIIFIINKNLFDKNTYNIVTKNYTVKQILLLIKKNNFKFNIKMVKSPILNQNSYKVSRKKFEKYKFVFSKNINNEIKKTLNLLKFLY